MKKVFYTIIALVTITTVSSCKKCGYCNHPLYGNGEAVCEESSTVPGLSEDYYKTTKAQCSADGGTWVITK